MSATARVPSPALPGADLVTAGLADLAAGRMTEAAMLVAGASTRLREAGYEVPPSPVADPEGELYALVRERVGDPAAHGAYNALRRRLASFLRSESRAPAG